MLKFLRKKGVAKKILIGLAIIIIPAFLLWGSGSIIRSRTNSNYAGMIFGKKIDFQQYSDGLRAFRNQAMMRYGDDYYKVQNFIDFNIETWDRLILLYEAGKRKIKVSDAEVIKRIADLTFFQKYGKFDNKLYLYLLDYVFKTSAHEFEEQIRQSLMLEKLFNQVTKEISLTEDELLENYKKENEKVKVNFLQISSDAFMSQITIADEEINDYYQQLKEELRKPPTVNIHYFGIEHPKDYTETDESAILDKMKKIASKIRTAADFEKISKSENLPIKETGFFSPEGPVSDIGWSYQFIQTSFNLKPNQISQPLKTQKGCYVLKLKERKDSYIPDIKESKEQITNVLKQTKIKELTKTKAKEYLDNILEIYRVNPQDVDFDEFATKWNLKSGKTELFSRQDYIPNIGISKTFYDASFGLKDKEEPFDVTSTDTGTFIIELGEYVPIDENKFLKEHESFKIKTLNNKKNEYFNNFFVDLKKKANLKDNINPSRSLIP